MRKLLLMGLLCPAFILSGQSNYAVADLSLPLTRHANAVVRRYDVKFEVLNKAEALETEHKAITILNQEASDEETKAFWYDKFVSIEEIEAAVYDAGGNLIKRVRKKEIADMKPAMEEVNNSRFKVFNFPHISFPFTIEYTVVRKYKGLMSYYPDFEPQEWPEYAVESASLEVVMPPGMALRVKELNLPPGCKKSDHHWEFQNLPAVQEEPFMPHAALDLPRVLTAPAQFALAEYEGDMSSWENFGRFISNLNANRGQLPEATIAKLRQLTAGCPDVPCKVEKVYAYLQDNTRYFFVGLGIGGWQPMPAKDVDEFKYSDCKGLSNYTVSMLEAVGVKAYYVLVRAGANEQSTQFPDFPNAKFNHVVACVPNGNDTIWLECTSQTESCGFMGTFTDNRPALLITPEGGKLVQTPRYDEQVNTVHRQTVVELHTDGSATLKSDDRYRGITQEYLAELESLHDEKRKKKLYDMLSLSDFEIVSLEMERKKGKVPELNRKLELAVPKFASVSGKRLFVPVVALAQKMNIPAVDSLRRFPVQATSRGFEVTDELVIKTPEGYSLENAAESTAIESPFGRYELTIRNEPGQLVVNRTLLLNNSIHSKEAFADLIVFLKGILNSDNSKLVLAKGT